MDESSLFFVDVVISDVDLDSAFEVVFYKEVLDNVKKRDLRTDNRRNSDTYC